MVALRWSCSITKWAKMLSNSKYKSHCLAAKENVTVYWRIFENVCALNARALSVDAVILHIRKRCSLIQRRNDYDIIKSLNGWLPHNDWVIMQIITPLFMRRSTGQIASREQTSVNCTDILTFHKQRSFLTDVTHWSLLLCKCSGTPINILIWKAPSTSAYYTASPPFPPSLHGYF